MEEEPAKDEENTISVSGASASDTFCRTMCGMICQKDVDIIQSMQTDALSKFEKTNEKFDKFNRLSADRYNRLHSHFQNHTKMLLDMKKDLDIVFRRIRNLKVKLTKQYGEAFKATAKNIHELEEELEAQSETGHTEEKPQTKSLPRPTNTPSVEQNTATQQHTQINSENQASASSPSTEDNLTKNSEEEQVGSQEKKAVYSTKLKPQLSSSDESYGTESGVDDSDDKDKNKINSCDDGDDRMRNNSDQQDNALSKSDDKQNVSKTQDKLQETFSSSDESLESDSDDNNSNKQLGFQSVTGNDQNLMQEEGSVSENEPEDEPKN